MTNEERSRAIRDLIARRTKIDCATPESARAALVASGIYLPSGELAPEYGGPPLPGEQDEQ